MGLSANLVVFLAILGAGFAMLLVYVFHRFLGSRGPGGSEFDDDGMLRARSQEQDGYMRSVRDRNFNSILFKVRGERPVTRYHQSQYSEGWYGAHMSQAQMSQVRSDVSSDYV